MDSYFAYAIKSEKDDRIYVGMTADVERRLKEHISGYVKSPKGYLPWKLIFVKEIKGRIEARRLEKYYKSGVGKEYLKTLNLINGPVVQRIE